MAALCPPGARQADGVSFLESPPACGVSLLMDSGSPVHLAAALSTESQRHEAGGTLKGSRLLLSGPKVAWDRQCGLEVEGVVEDASQVAGWMQGRECQGPGSHVTVCPRSPRCIVSARMLAVSF